MTFIIAKDVVVMLCCKIKKCSCGVLFIFYYAENPPVYIQCALGVVLFCLCRCRHDGGEKDGFHGDIVLEERKGAVCSAQYGCVTIYRRGRYSCRHPNLHHIMLLP